MFESNQEIRCNWNCADCSGIRTQLSCNLVLLLPNVVSISKSISSACSTSCGHWISVSDTDRSTLLDILGISLLQGLPSDHKKKGRWNGN